MNREPVVDVDMESVKFFDDSSFPRGEIPKLVIVVGGNGAGKTTHIHEKFSKGYVIINAEEIYRNIKVFDDFGEVSQKLVNEIGELIAYRAINERRNIVLEMIADKVGSLDPIIGAMTAIGYKVDIIHISSDIDEAYRRHLNAVKEDRGYLPTYFSEDYHRRCIIKAINGLANS